ncbi:T9SS type A sorting domain-containing protein [Seonamhaeicola sp. ML3]|uniref:T9SS type A sorting domain-containing protein n=1 Tax=Seonamhaeicola sp. ML3 TaxID=2937786 RepID=UPI00200C5241|nr:T9SS type A sorting domain-containing protein [Seonamhaeicola sp. ML3]
MKILFTILFCLATYNLLPAQDHAHAPASKLNPVFKCHPNPVEDELYILGTNKIKSVEFIDVLGKRAAIYIYNKSIIKLNVSYLKKGIYIIKVVDEKNRVETKKLVVK